MTLLSQESFQKYYPSN